jgi:cystathionine gamma-synthase
LRQPLHHGADVVVHSATKYLGGHSDVVGGALMTSKDELQEKLRFRRIRSARCLRRSTAGSCCAA